MTSFHGLIILFLSVTFRLINSQSNTLLTSTISLSTTTTTSNDIEQTINIIVNTTFSINESSTFAHITSSSKLQWWILIVLLLSVTIVLILMGVVYYYRRQTPYRRFLQTWRSRDEDDTDDIILQLEQPPDTLNNQWPVRITFN